MATAAPPHRAPSGPDGGNPHVQASSVSTAPQPGLQDPGPHGPPQDPGAACYPHTHMSGRPLVYLPPPPHPPPFPFFHYQWPMPFPYNPFAGFPGMGYSVVMPPFPPAPYMEAPAYILPHPHMQPVDYRRMLHPQAHAVAAPYQNPNQSRKTRPLQIPPVRETVNSEVQTEPTPSRCVNGYVERCPPVSSESGRGTDTSSPSSSSSSSQKQRCAEVDDYDLPRKNATDVQVNRQCPSGTDKRGFDIPPKAPKPILASIGASLDMKKRCIGEDKAPPCSSGHRDMCSVCSTDSMVPVCCSSDRDEDFTQERRVSFPNILMSWGADKVLPPNEDQPPPHDEAKPERETSVCHARTGTKTSQLEADGVDVKGDAESVFTPEDTETQHEMLKPTAAGEGQKQESRKDDESLGRFGSIRQFLPSKDEGVQQELLHSQNKSHDATNDTEEESYAEMTSLEETAGVIYQTSLNASQMKRNMNESLWSLESLAAYKPSKEWLIQNGLCQESDLITVVTEDAENGFLSIPSNLDVRASRDRRLSRRFSSGARLCSASCCQKFDNQLPVTCLQNATVASRADNPSPAVEAQLKRGLDVDRSGTHSPTSPTLLQSKMSLHTPPEQDMKGSSEPVANQSPNQESHNVREQQERRLCSPQPVQAPPFNPVEEEKSSSEDQAALGNGAEAEVEAATCGSEEVNELRKENVCPPVVDQKSVTVSPSKGHLVDCGIQCSELQKWKCSCDELKDSMMPNRKYVFRFSDLKKAAGVGNGDGQKNIRRKWKNRGGRNPRY